MGSIAVREPSMTAPGWTALPDDVPVVRLSSDALAVSVLPANGGDIHSIVDRRTGIDLLWKSPWGPGLRTDEGASSRDRWIAATWGGWQLLMPNTGDEALERGHQWGFHGEAGVRSWAVQGSTSDELQLSLQLASAPLDVRRTYRVDQATLTVTTSVTNRSPESVEFLWGEHPSFSEGIASGAVLEIDATTVAIELASNAGVHPGERLAWPGPGGRDDGPLARIPDRSSGRSLLAFLEGVRGGSYRLRNDARGVAVRVQWPVDLFPCVWLWEELTATADAPWDGRAYAVGIEPQTASPAVGMTELRRRGGHGLRLAAGGPVTGTISLTVEHLG